MTETEDNVLVVELRAITAAALIATTAAERRDWAEAEKCISDVISRSQIVQRHIASTVNELRGCGDTRLHEEPED